LNEFCCWTSSTILFLFSTDPVALEEEKCSEMGDPASWFCAVCHHFAAPDLVTGRDLIVSSRISILDNMHNW
jgi:hypothetical protein